MLLSSSFFVFVFFLFVVGMGTWHGSLELCFLHKLLPLQAFIWDELSCCPFLEIYSFYYLLCPTVYINATKINSPKLLSLTVLVVYIAFKWHFILPVSLTPDLTCSRVYWGCPFLQVFLASSDNQTDKPDIRGIQSLGEGL